MPPDRTLAIRGTHVAFEEAGGGLPFVWCHGLTSSRAHENEVGHFDLGALHDVARVVRYDARGHGESPATPDAADYGWDQLALDLFAVADALGLERFVAAGASMGAATVLHAAVRAPERLRALVVAIPPTAWETRKAQAAVYEGAAKLVEARGLDALVKAMSSQPPPAIFAEQSDPYRVRPQIEERWLPTVMRGAAASDLPPLHDLSRVELPTLILAWDTDSGHPLSTAEALAEALPDAVLDVARHVDDIARWPAHVRAFLRTLD